MRAFLLVVGISSLLAGAHAPTPPEKLRPYRTWATLTPVAVDMTPSVAFLCNMPEKWREPNPHVPKVFRVFVNPVGEKSARSKKPRYPVGTMIVKEKFDRSQTNGSRRIKDGERPELYTAMIKRARGFDSANGDWEYVVLDRDFNRGEMKDASTCQSCHRRVKERDFVYADYKDGFLRR
jgi:hypothetical protein